MQDTGVQGRHHRIFPLPLWERVRERGKGCESSVASNLKRQGATGLVPAFSQCRDTTFLRLYYMRQIKFDTTVVVQKYDFRFAIHDL